MRWRKPLLGLLFSLLLTEWLLRIGFGFYATHTPMNCGVRPELLARLAWAYSHEEPHERETDGLAADARRGYRLTPGLRDFDFHGTQLSTDAIGARGTREYAVPRASGATRIVALGDSFTFGEGVGDDDTWPAQLERSLASAEVVNLGAPAYAHDQMYFALEDVGVALEPDVVILGFYPNDLMRDELTFYCADKPRFTRAGSEWVLENLPVPTPSEAWRRYRRLPLLYAIPRVIVEQRALSPPTDEDGEERASEILERTRALAEAHGARFVMVRLPDRPEGALPPHDFFAAYCARTQTECVDTMPLFASGGDDEAARRARYHRPNDIHYSREGYAVVAEALRAHFAAHPIAPRGPGSTP